MEPKVVLPKTTLLNRYCSIVLFYKIKKPFAKWTLFDTTITQFQKSLTQTKI
jgi:hypothetical protein